MSNDVCPRLERLEYLREWSPGDLDGPVDDLIMKLQVLKLEALEKGYWDLEVDVDHYYDDVTIYVKAKRLESDAEYNERLEVIRMREEQKKERARKQVENTLKKQKLKEEEERKLLAQLLAKYGSN